MKPMYKFAAGTGTAIALTIAGALSAQAQTKSGPAYIVVELNVKDQEGFKEYAEKAPATVSQYGGSFIVLAANAHTIEGAEPNGFVTILKFDTVDAAQKWLKSPEYGAVKGIRHKTSDTRQYVVEGMPDE
jgi:uncharacterized protein (DUF1330 family)